VPLGGYVKMAGETPDAERAGRPDEFLSRSKWARFQILVMGPVMNIVLALVLTAAVFTFGADVPAFQDDPPVVGSVAPGTPAEQAGVRTGDRILSIAGQPMATWEDVYRSIGVGTNRDFPVAVLRAGNPIELQAKAWTQGELDVAQFGVMPDVCPHVVRVVRGSPADLAGVRPGDLVFSVEGERVVFQSQLVQAISRHANRRITITVRRNGRQIDLHPTPAANGRIGISTGDALKIVQPGPLGAAKMSLTQNIEFSRVILRTLGGLLTRRTSPSDLSGPVAIAQMSGQAAASGLRLYLLLMALISLNLGLVNLLPIPVLDGGHIFILAVEGIGRRDLSAKVKEKVLLAGLAALMILMVTVIYNDLARIFWR
jgi:regulator of sigma E protease